MQLFKPLPTLLTGLVIGAFVGPMIRSKLGV